MAIMTVQYESACLNRNVSVQVILPGDRRNERGHYGEKPERLLMLLHGYGEEGTVWLNYTKIVELAQQYHMCVVMPSGENRFYLNGRGSGSAYASYVGEELPEYICHIFGLKISRENTIVGGLSMGGFGAIHTALLYPGRFGKVIAMSSALIHRDICGLKPGEVYKLADYDYYYETFGALDRLAASDNNPEVLVERILAAGEAGMMPKLYMAVGRSDFLLEQNRQFAAFLRNRQVDFTYIEDEGDHNYEFWNKYLEAGLDFCLGEK